jgi:type II secretory pathway pseudopilin PulG
VVVAIIAILASLLLPALRLAKIKAQGTYCMNNGHQIVVAAWLYSDENGDWLPPNPAGGILGGWVAGNVSRYPDATNILFLTDPRCAKLGPYTRSASVWKCPADHSRLGPGSERVRSFAVNEAVGTKPEIAAPVDGEWLDGSGFHLADHPWRTYGRISQMVLPAPASLFIIADEAESSIHDAGFGVQMTVNPTSMCFDWPAIRHNYAGTFAFGDGHTEVHKWRDRRTGHSSSWPPGGLLVREVQGNPDNPDILWIQQHTSARAQ